MLTLPARGEHPSGCESFVAVEPGNVQPASPLVFVTIAAGDADPATVRVSEVTTSGFGLAQVESSISNGPHGAESAQQVMIQPGEHRLQSWSRLVAGIVTTTVQHGVCAAGLAGGGP